VGVGQYPNLLPGLDIDTAAANEAVLTATLGAVAADAIFQWERER